jgi:DNA end-binding protein Ku
MRAFSADKARDALADVPFPSDRQDRGPQARRVVMVIRANWKGYLKIEELTCPVALHGAVSIAERMAFHTLNRATGHRVHRQFIDEETGKPVPHDAQVKGYETGKGDYVMIEPDEIAAAVPESDKTLSIEAFIPRGAIDDLYFDRPYYLVPGEGHV